MVPIHVAKAILVLIADLLFRHSVMSLWTQLVPICINVDKQNLQLVDTPYFSLTPTYLTLLLHTKCYKQSKTSQWGVTIVSYYSHICTYTRYHFMNMIYI